MKNIITIKGMHSGIILSIKENANFEEVKKEVAEKFKTSSQFFGKADKAISFQGKKLSEDQQNEIIDIIQKNCQLHIVCIAEDNPAKEAMFKSALQSSTESTAHVEMPQSNGNAVDTFPVNNGREQAVQQQANQGQIAQRQLPQSMLADVNTGQFFKGNLRSGQVLDVETSIIIIGDVNIGAKVISKGNVIILGSLKGNVYAGSAGNTNAFVVALEMEPLQIRIADTIARSPDRKPSLLKRTKNSEPKETKIAFCEKNNIYIEPLNKNVLSDIHL